MRSFTEKPSENHLPSFTEDSYHGSHIFTLMGSSNNELNNPNLTAHNSNSLSDTQTDTYTLAV